MQITCVIDAVIVCVCDRDDDVMRWRGHINAKTLTQFSYWLWIYWYCPSMVFILSDRSDTVRPVINLLSCFCSSKVRCSSGFSYGTSTFLHEHKACCLPLLIHILSRTFLFLLTRTVKLHIQKPTFIAHDQYAVILLRMKMSPLMLNCAVWHLLVDSWRIQHLPHMYLLLFCLELTTIAHCCWFYSWCDISLPIYTELMQRE